MNGEGHVAMPHLGGQPCAPGEGQAPAVDRSAWRARVRRAIEVAKQVAFAVYLYCGYVQLRDWVLGKLGRSRAIVLYYHRIGGCDVLSKPVEEFRRELDYLKSHYECISLRELCQRLTKEVALRRPVAVVTFDDGYRDNWTEAVPLLRETGIPATFFVATGFIGTERDFPHDERAARRENRPVRPYPKLTWDDLRAMQAAGFEIGSHTVNHTNLAQADEVTVRRELVESLATLNRELGTRQRPFSFPWGKPSDISEQAMEEAWRRAGYYAAASAYGGPNRKRSHAFKVRRMDLGNGRLTHLAVRARLAGLDPDYLRLKLTKRDL